MADASKLDSPQEYFKQVLEPNYNAFMGAPSTFQSAFNAASQLETPRVGKSTGREIRGSGRFLSVHSRTPLIFSATSRWPGRASRANRACLTTHRRRHELHSGAQLAGFGRLGTIDPR
jgi:hypothetical protein